MFNRFLATLSTLALAAATGCVSSAPIANRSNLDDPQAGSGSRSSVLTSEQLQGEHGTILDAMSRKLFNFRVDKRYSCPAISLRGSPNTVPGLTEPLVFVDGTRTVDTCILNLMSASDVARVEVYPMGFTHRPGYATSPHGLILIFTRGR